METGTQGGDRGAERGIDDKSDVADLDRRGFGVDGAGGLKSEPLVHELGIDATHLGGLEQTLPSLQRRLAELRVDASVVALVEPGPPERIELVERRRVGAEPDLDLERLLDGPIEPLDETATLADVRRRVRDLDAELRAAELEPSALIPGPAVDVELVRWTDRRAQRAQPAAHVHLVLGQAVARLRDEARAVVDEGAEDCAPDLAVDIANVRPLVKVADDEVQRMAECELDVPLGAEHVQHPPARGSAVQGAGPPRAAQRAPGDLLAALDDCRQRRRLPRGLLLAQRDDTRQRSLRDRANPARVLARLADQGGEAAALEPGQPPLQRANGHADGAAVRPRDRLARREA